MPKDLFILSYDHKNLVYNKELAKAENITGEIHVTFGITTTNTTAVKLYFYQFKFVLNATKQIEAEDSPINIDKHWVLFYLLNRKTLKYEMTKPSEEDIQAEQTKLILDQSLTTTQT